MFTFRDLERESVRKLINSTLTGLAVLLVSLSAIAQTPSPSPAAPAAVRVVGEVKAIDPAARQIIGITRMKNSFLICPAFQATRITAPDKPTQFLRINVRTLKKKTNELHPAQW